MNIYCVLIVYEPACIVDIKPTADLVHQCIVTWTQNSHNVYHFFGALLFSYI